MKEQSFATYNQSPAGYDFWERPKSTISVKSTLLNARGHYNNWIEMIKVLKDLFIKAHLTEL